MARPYLPPSEAEREDLWLDAIEAGATTVAEISRMTGLTVRRIQQRVKDARGRRGSRPEPRLYPVYPVDTTLPLHVAQAEYVATGVCIHVHEGEAPEDALANCEVCNRSRLDHLWVGIDKRVTELPKVGGKATPTCYTPDPDGLKGGVG